LLRRAAPVPLIAGINNDELTALLPASARPATVAAYETLVLQTIPTIGAQVLQQYPRAELVLGQLICSIDLQSPHAVMREFCQKW
jgi:hypothetical protein